MKQTIGKQSIELKKEVYVQSGASIVGSKEKEGPLGLCFDCAKRRPDAWDEQLGGRPRARSRKRRRNLRSKRRGCRTVRFA